MMAKGNIGVYDVRIAIVDPRAARGYRIGPTVTTYQQCSDCDDETIYGDGSLWIYGADGGGLLRVSERTGRVVERWPLPGFVDGLLAVDRDGLWFAQSVEGGFPRHPSRRELLDETSLYHVAPGMRVPQRVRRVGLYGADWIVASGHTVWLDSRTSTFKSTAFVLRGARGTVVQRAKTQPAGYECTQHDGRTPTIAGTPRLGIYCVTIDADAANGTSGKVIRIVASLHSGKSVAETDFGEPTYYTPAVSYHGAFFFLDPANIYDGTVPRRHAVLYREAPR
jgi:hypothetical protein